MAGKGWSWKAPQKATVSALPLSSGAARLTQGELWEMLLEAACTPEEAAALRVSRQRRQAAKAAQARWDAEQAQHAVELARAAVVSGDTPTVEELCPTTTA